MNSLRTVRLSFADLQSREDHFLRCCGKVVPVEKQSMEDVYSSVYLHVITPFARNEP